MSFIREKEIPSGSGNRYLYEVENHREGGKVIQRHIRYIGKSGRLGTTRTTQLQLERAITYQSGTPKKPTHPNITKEPWQMTEDEWRKSDTPGRQLNEPRSSSYARIIEEAYRSRENVPLNILKTVPRIYQLALENSPEFQEIFGGSKSLTGAWENEGTLFQDGSIVSPDNVTHKPARVFHGGATPIMSWKLEGETKPIFFTDDEKIAQYWATGMSKGKKSYITTAYLIMNHPIEFQTPPYANVSQSFMNSRYDDFLYGKYKDYDGMIFRRLTESGFDSDIYVVRSPKQIIPIESEFLTGSNKGAKNELFKFSVVPNTTQKRVGIRKGFETPQ